MRFIITGGGSGIGGSLASRLAAFGKKVVVVGRRLDPLQEISANYPDHITPLVADITKAEDRQRIAREVKGTGNVLINNAGIADPCQLRDLSETSLASHLDVNFIAPTLLTQLLLPNLTHGRALFISSGLAHHAGPGMFSYGVSKAAMFNAWRYWKSEHPEIAFGIAQPGMVDTPIQTHLRGCDTKRLPMLEFFMSTHKKGQLLLPTTAAKFLSWLLLDTSSAEFASKEWSIYDGLHHKYWAALGEVVAREATMYEKPSSEAQFRS